MTDDLPSRTLTVTFIDPSAIELPFDPRQVFGRARPPVHVEINGHRYPEAVEQAKKHETRARRIARCVAMLGA